MTIYSPDTLIFLFGTSLLFHVQSVASWPAYRFLKRQVRWSGIAISFRIFHSLLTYSTVKGFVIVNKAKIDVFLELSCFFDVPEDFGNLISSSSALSKSSLIITVHILLKPGLENFKHYFASNWVQLYGSLSILWNSLSLGLEKKLTFSSPLATAKFSKFAGILGAALNSIIV